MGDIKIGRIAPRDYEQSTMQPVNLKRLKMKNNILEASTSVNMSARMAAMQLPGLLNGSAIQNTNTASYT